MANEEAGKPTVNVNFERRSAGTNPTAYGSEKMGSDSSLGRPENANVLGSAGLNTAGGKIKEATFIDGLKTVRLSELTSVHEKPCVREALMTGIGAGFGSGGLRAILGASVWVSCNWAVGAFVTGSFLMHEYCQRRRVLERQGMKRVVEVMEKKRSEKQQEQQAAKEMKKISKD